MHDIFTPLHKTREIRSLGYKAVTVCFDTEKVTQITCKRVPDFSPFLFTRDVLQQKCCYSDQKRFDSSFKYIQKIHASIINHVHKDGEAEMVGCLYNVCCRLVS